MSIEVLYADHNRDDRELMDDFFSNYPDIELVRFSTGKLLLEYIVTMQAGGFCFLLLDVDMPDMSGIETLKQLRSLPATKDTKTILFSHRVTDKEKKDAYSLDAELIAKPQTMDFVSEVGTKVVEHCYNMLAD